MKNSKIISYRPEIDGLRAISIFAVIFFHTNIKIFSGGFIGVDIFFVISGYLITSIILKQINNNKFSIINFYERRARRILPALFFVLFGTLAAGWVLLMPNEMKILSQNIFATVLFISNIFFYIKNFNYFDLLQESNPLIHLWSLGVEEQYYFLYPLLLLIITKYFKTNLAKILSYIAILSLILSQLLYKKYPDSTYYLLHTRIWEIIIGCLCSFYLSRKESLQSDLRNLLSILGFFLIFFSFFYYTKETPTPSFYTLIPIIGAALIIIFCNKKTFIYRILSNRILVFFGLISYSAYLWHQPVLAFYKIANYNNITLFENIFLVIFIFFLSFLTWMFIEKPIREKKFFDNTKKLFIFYTFAISLFLLIGIVGHFNSGYPNRDDLIKRFERNYGLSLKCNGNTTINERCSTSLSPEVAIYGNSYAMHLVYGFREIFKDYSFVQLTQDSCSPFSLLELKKFGNNSCSSFNKNSMNTILNNKSINLVIVSSSFSDLLEEENFNFFKQQIMILEKNDIRVIIFGPTPTPSYSKNIGRCLFFSSKYGNLEKCDFFAKDIHSDYKKTINKLKLLTNNNSISLINLSDVICDLNKCYTSLNKKLIYEDTIHLTREGSEYIFNFFKNKLKILMS